MAPPILFKKLDPRAKIPQYQTPGSSGMDISIILDEDLWASPKNVYMLKTGLSMQMPRNREAQIRPRSGLSLQLPNYIANSPATIDSDYRAEIKILFINNSTRTYVLRHGDRIAQIVFSRAIHVDIEEVEELSNTIRSEGGFGHTGL